MLSENIRRLRESKGLSQGELAVRLNVVRQTVSKWERGLSVPDADLLIALSEALGQPVSALLGEAVAGTFFHAFEWVFVRAAPVVLLAAVAGLCLMRKRP